MTTTQNNPTTEITKPEYSKTLNTTKISKGAGISASFFGTIVAGSAATVFHPVIISPLPTAVGIATIILFGFGTLMALSKETFVIINNTQNKDNEILSNLNKYETKVLTKAYDDSMTNPDKDITVPLLITKNNNNGYYNFTFNTKPRNIRTNKTTITITKTNNLLNKTYNKEITQILDNKTNLIQKLIENEEYNNINQELITSSDQLLKEYSSITKPTIDETNTLKQLLQQINQKIEENLTKKINQFKPSRFNNKTLEKISTQLNQNINNEQKELDLV